MGLSQGRHNAAVGGGPEEKGTGWEWGVFNDLKGAEV